MASGSSRLVSLASGFVATDARGHDSVLYSKSRKRRCAGRGSGKQDDVMICHTEMGENCNKCKSCSRDVYSTSFLDDEVEGTRVSRWRVTYSISFLERRGTRILFYCGRHRQQRLLFAGGNSANLLRRRSLDCFPCKF